jgi:hypothetical protein
VLVSLVSSLLRALLDVIATSHGDQARLQAEVLALRRQVQVWGAFIRSYSETANWLLA